MKTEVVVKLKLASYESLVVQVSVVPATATKLRHLPSHSSHACRSVPIFRALHRLSLRTRPAFHRLCGLFTALASGRWDCVGWSCP